MNTQLRWAGIAMVLGSILMIIRMAPIFAILPDDMPFPPATTLDLVRLIDVAGGRWHLSHVMGLIAVSLFIFGYWGHAQVLASLQGRRVGIAAAVVATAAFVLFAIALVIDGFAMPAVAHDYVSDVAGTVTSLEDVRATHDRALFFSRQAYF